MTKIILSICIPTRNRARFLDKNLTKIASILNESVEIVIGDDGSTDDTNSVVKNFIKSNPKIRVIYKQNLKPIFFDKNVLDIVKRASGDFCWLLGDDDIPEHGSITKILSIINKHPDISLIHLNYSRFDNILNKVTAKKMVNGIDKDIHFKDFEDYYFKPIADSYFKFLGTHTITMSSDVINRKKWMKVEKDLKKYIGHNFIHSFLIGNIISSNNSVYFVAKPQVQYLSNNHRVWPNDIWKDYNHVLLNYLQSIGYSKEKIKLMKSQQSEYEKREALSKNKVISYLYVFALKVYNRLFKLNVKRT